MRPLQGVPIRRSVHLNVPGDWRVRQWAAHSPRCLSYDKSRRSPATAESLSGCDPKILSGTVYSSSWLRVNFLITMSFFVQDLTPKRPQISRADSMSKSKQPGPGRNVSFQSGYRPGDIEKKEIMNIRSSSPDGPTNTAFKHQDRKWQRFNRHEQNVDP